MNIKETQYSANQVSGGSDFDDRIYSESEVLFISNLFNEFYEENADFYNNDAERAYSDFYDAYSSNPVISDHVNNPAFTLPTAHNPKPARIAAGVLGGAAGITAARLLTQKLRNRKRELTEKVNKGMANKTDLLELSRINKKLNKLTLVGGAIGATAGAGSVALLSKLKRSK